MADGLIRVSGFADAQGYDLSIDEQRMKYMKELAKSYFGLDAISKATDEWAGLRPLTPDDKPIFGPISSYNNVFINVGHGTRGLTQGLGTGKLLSDYINSTISEPTLY